MHTVRTTHIGAMAERVHELVRRSSDVAAAAAACQGVVRPGDEAALVVCPDGVERDVVAVLRWAADEALHVAGELRAEANSCEGKPQL